MIEDLAQELHFDENLLSAMAGPAISLTVDTVEAAMPVRMTGEDLTRVLVNLVKNSVEAMPTGGRIHLSLRQSPTEPGADCWLTLNFEDNGPGIEAGALERIFEPGYTTRTKPGAANSTSAWKGDRRGLGLSITRSIVEAAGGRIQAANRDPSGACFQIELPVRTV
jgi:signal transduction histidine kinase